MSDTSVTPELQQPCGLCTRKETAMKYEVLHSWGATTEDAVARLKEQVDRFIAMGWKPHGSVSIAAVRESGGNGQPIYRNSTNCAQAMTYEEQP
jgi:hypothetical protein